MLALNLAAGALTQDYYAYDALILLDGGWRIRSGQVPHLDFSSPLGSLHPSIVALTLPWTAGTASSLLVAPLVLVPLLAAGIWPVLTRDRCAGRALVLGLFVLCLLITATPLGMRSGFGASLAMQYNRFGWALLACLQLRLFVLPAARAATTAGTACTALLVGTLLASKANYAGAAAASCVVAWAVRATSWRASLVPLVAGLVLWTLLLVLLGCPPGAAWTDHGRILAQAEGTSPLTRVVNVAGRDAGLLGALVLYAAVVVRSARRAARSPLWTVVVAVLSAAAIAGLGLALNVGNLQGFDLPSHAVAAVVLDRRLEPPPPDDSGGVRTPPGWPALLLGSVVFTGFFAARDLYSLATICVREHGGPLVPEPGLPSDIPALRGLRYPHPLPREVIEGRILRDGDPETIGIDVALEDMHRLTRKNLLPGDLPAALDWINPLPFLLRAPPPRGLPTFWHVGRTVAATAHDSVPRAFAEATVLVVPRFHPANTSSRWLLESMATSLDVDWEIVDESPLYRLHRRRPNR